MREDRLPPPAERRGFLELVPDLVVDVVSPTDRPGQVRRKVAMYIDAGVQVVWMVDPLRMSVTIHAPDGVGRVLRETDTLDGGDVLPGFRLPVAEIFV